LLSPEHRVHPLAELFLFEAARAQHTYDLIRPALNAGHLVLCERYTLATSVYQGIARGLPLPLIRTMNRIATGGLRPDLTLVLDIPEREFIRRKRRRLHDRMEQESQFRKKVRAGYRRLIRQEPHGFLINADRDISNVQDDILHRVNTVLPQRQRL
jgi:dTMP kinase